MSKTKSEELEFFKSLNPEMFKEQIKDCSAITFNILIEPRILDHQANQLIEEIKYFIEARMQKTVFRNSYEVSIQKENTL